MSKGIRVVLPFRPFAPESELHKELADFDWIAAMQMLAHTVRVICRCPVHVITDVDTDLPLPCLKYETTHRRLMLWNLEVCLKYLESEDFDRDTVMMDSDQLVYQDLAPLFRGGVDLGVLIRKNNDKTTQAPNENRFPILNGVQLFSRKGKGRLQKFYREALRVAEELPEDRIVWGADTDALRILLEPLEAGLSFRHGARVMMQDSRQVLEAISEKYFAEDGSVQWPSRPVCDFRWRRKTFMRRFYDATIMAGAVR